MTSGWPLVPIKDVARIVGGSTPKSGTAEFWDGQIPWATPKDLSDVDGKFIDDTPRKISQLGLNSCSSELLPPNSVLFSSRAPIGHVAINTVPMATNQGFKSFVPTPKIDASYLYWWLKCHRSDLERLGNGATFKEVSKAVVERIEIPLPALEEQKRIAAILDQADDIRRNRQRAIERLNQLGQAIFYEMFGDPVCNPMAWDTSSLDSASMINPRKDTTLDDCDEVTFLPMAAVSEQGKIISEEVRTYGSVKKGFTFFRKGDVLLAKITPCFENGKSAKTDDMKHPVGFGSTEFHVLRPSVSLHPSYLFSILHDKRFRNKAEGNMTGSAGQKRVPSTYLKEYMIPLPPMALQEEFASRIEAIEGLVAQNCHMLGSFEKLFASLEHRAFTGQL